MIYLVSRFSGMSSEFLLINQSIGYLSKIENNGEKLEINKV